jgi:REP element-mobilizing transposase RayT
MTQQVLEETGRFNVTLVNSGADTITAAGKAAFDIILVEATLEDLSLKDLVTALRLNQPTLPIMVALPLGEQALPDAAQYFDVQGILTKPFYIPDLEKQIAEALTKPVGGVTPPPRETQHDIPVPPAARPATQTTTAPSTGSPTKRTTTPKRAAPPAPAWLDDVNRAAQYLTTLTLESSAEAALLMRGQHLIAFAGQCSKADADELSATIAANWAKETDPGGGAQVRFLRLSSGADYLVYSTLAAQDVVLSMAFQAETPLGQIRKQAKRLTDALVTNPTEPPAPVAATAPAPKTFSESAPIPLSAQVLAPMSGSVSTPAPSTVEAGPTLSAPASDFVPAQVSTPATANAPTVAATGMAAPTPMAVPTAEPSQLQTDLATADPVQISKFKTKPLPPLPDFSPDQKPKPTSPFTAAAMSAVQLPETADDIDLGLDWLAALQSSPQAEAFQPDWTPATSPQAQPDEEVEPIPDQESLNTLSQQLLQLERQSIVEQPLLLDLPPAPLPNIRRTPHGLYDLSYTFLFLPRLPHLSLSGDLKARLEQWLIALADTHDWDATTIQIEENHVEISLSCAPADSPERIVKTILAETSDKILAEYPRLAAAHAKRPGAFWSTGYYVVTPGRHLAPAEVTAFVEYQRREQSGGRL